MFRKALKLILVLIVLLLLTMLAVTLLTPSRQTQYTFKGSIPPNHGAALRLAEALTFRTVSYDDSSDGYLKMRELSRFKAWMKATYPLCFASAELKDFEQGSMVLHFHGRNSSLKPAMFLAHLDVVPADTTHRGAWRFPPFAGVVQHDTIYGRGSMDDKSVALGMLEAMEQHLKTGHKPNRDILFAFGHDEETGGKKGAQVVCKWLKEQGVHPEFIADEGFSVLEGLVPGISKPVAVIGVSEKGYLCLKLSVHLAGGHSSMPKPEAAATVLASAVQHLLHTGLEPAISAPVADFFKTLAPEMGFGYGFLFTNLWITKPLVMKVMLGNEKTAATVRSTIALTRFTAGYKDNLVPADAEATVNIRMLPGESIASCEARVREILHDDRIKMERVHDFNEPATVSPASGAGWDAICASIGETFQGVLIAPGLVITGTDCKNYEGLCGNIYRFQPMRFTKTNTALIHGENEQLPVQNYSEMIVYYSRLFGRL